MMPFSIPFLTILIRIYNAAPRFLDLKNVFIRSVSPKHKDFSIAFPPLDYSLQTVEVYQANSSAVRKGKIFPIGKVCSFQSLPFHFSFIETKKQKPPRGYCIP
jgi:hypothetical protein